MKRLFDLNREQLKALAEYKDVLETGRFFKKNFWQSEKNIDGIRPNCQIITRYCLEYIAGISVDMLPSYNLKQIKNILTQNHLFGMVQTVFNNDILKVIVNAYPVEFKKRELTEWTWSKHGLWENDKYVIEAVQYMVLKEGIRRVDLIPKMDWKKRLLKYGIYNVLSRFNWSIYKMFDFVYPGRFYPADFKYKAKWKTDSSKDFFDNAFRLMDKTFKEKQLTHEQVLLLNITGFRKIGLITMLLSIFEGSTIKAKEFYFYKTHDNEENQKKLKGDINKILIKKQDEIILQRLGEVSNGKYIYNLHSSNRAYSYIKRQAKIRDLKIPVLIEQFGFIYKTAKEDHSALVPQEIWDLRKNGYTYVEIAEKLGSNPTTISNMCKKHFGGDPLIPRPIDKYITVQELMNRYLIDHKTIMKLVHDNKFENHMTIRFRFLKKSEIIPAILDYKKKSLQHQALLNRYHGT